jgi:broad specificity phosphatase PhoE
MRSLLGRATGLVIRLMRLSGVWDGLSTQEAMEIYPDEWERFLADPYAHRAPRAESYHDLSGEWALHTDRRSVQC